LGAPASGKSTLAERLLARYGGCCCRKDDFKEILFDELGIGDAQWSRHLSDASFAIMFAVVAGLRDLSAGPLLLDGNFRPGQHEAPLRQVLKNPEGVTQILCEASPAVREVRLHARAAHRTRHPGHLDHLPQPHPAATGFLDLPGLKLKFDSGADGELPFLQLLTALDQWLGQWPSTSSRSG